LTKPATDVVHTRADLKEWWDRRYAELGTQHFDGSVRDRNFNRLEIEQAVSVLRPHLRSGDAVLDAGCGHGTFLRALARALPFRLRLVGVELSDVVQTPGEEHVFTRVTSDVFEYLATTPQRFRAIYTQRAVINFLDQKSQLEFIRLAGGRLVPDGRIVLSELFRADLESHNACRARLGLPPLGIQDHIVPLDELQVRRAFEDEYEIEVRDYLNTYMLVTHILYPHFVARPRHNQPIHGFAADLPEMPPGLSPYKVMVLIPRQPPRKT
jgi:2-polyprenyl-3-methyl-5-hydroxy-6-metoxy-1,4-benzoquinol methylase